MTTPAFTAPGSVLTVMAHPDDAELWAGGTLALCGAAGAAVTIAVPRHPEPRAAEAAAGAAVLGAGLYQLEQPTTAAPRELLLETQPEVVITHPLRDVHADHRRIAEVLLNALPEVVITTGHPRRVYTADTYNGLTLDGTIPAHTVVDISSTWTTKQRALAAHASQPQGLGRPPRAARPRPWGRGQHGAARGLRPRRIRVMAGSPNSKSDRVTPEHLGHDWPAHGGNPFDADLPWAGRLYWARAKPSRVFPPDREPAGDELYAAIPMGYTTLATLERLALFHRGRRLAAWEQGPPSSNVQLAGLQQYQVLLPPDDEGRYQLVGVNWPERFAVGAAEQLSGRVDGPVLLCRVVDHCGWH